MVFRGMAHAILSAHPENDRNSRPVFTPSSGGGKNTGHVSNRHSVRCRPPGRSVRCKPALRRRGILPIRIAQCDAIACLLNTLQGHWNCSAMPLGAVHFTAALLPILIPLLRPRSKPVKKYCPGHCVGRCPAYRIRRVRYPCPSSVPAGVHLWLKKRLLPPLRVLERSGW